MKKLLKKGKHLTIPIFFSILCIMFFFFFSELINIDELIGAVRKLQNIPDEFKLQQISEVLSKIDDDHDGSIRLDTVLKVRNKNYNIS